MKEVQSKDQEAKKNKDQVADDRFRVDIHTDAEFSAMVAVKGVKMVEFYPEFSGPSRPLISNARRIIKRFSSNVCPVLYFTVLQDEVTEGIPYRGKCCPVTQIFVDSEVIDIVVDCDIVKIENTVIECLSDCEKKREPFAIRKSSSIVQDDDIGKETTWDAPIFMGKTVYNVSKSDSLENIVSSIGERLDNDNWIVESPVELTTRIIIIKPNISMDVKKASDLKNFIAKRLFIWKEATMWIPQAFFTIKRKDQRSIEDRAQARKVMMKGQSIVLVVSSGRTGVFTDTILSEMFADSNSRISKKERLNPSKEKFEKNAMDDAVEVSFGDADTAQIMKVLFPDYKGSYISDGIPYHDFERQERTLAIIRPTAAAKYEKEIINDIKNAGFVTIFLKRYAISTDEAIRLYKMHRNRYYFDNLIREMTMSTSTIMVLQKTHAINEFKTLIGPASKEKLTGRQNTLRAKYDTWATGVNCIHGSFNRSSARFEIGIFFPVQTTLAMLKPGYTDELLSDITKIVRRNKFSVLGQTKTKLKSKTIYKLYKQHEAQSYFRRLVNYIASGDCYVMALKRETAVDALREIVGPFKPSDAKVSSPNSLRAIYGKDEVENALHASEDASKAEVMIKEIFGKVRGFKSLREFDRGTDLKQLAFYATEDVTRSAEDELFEPLDIDYDEKVEYLIQIVTIVGPPIAPIPPLSMILHGSEGKRSEFISMCKSQSFRTPLSTGSVTKYVHKDKEIGQLSKFEILGSEDSFPKSWHVRSIEVFNRTTLKKYFIGVDSLIQPNRGVCATFTEIIESEVKEPNPDDFIIMVETAKGKYTGTQAAANAYLIDNKGLEIHASLLTCFRGTYLPLESGRISFFTARRTQAFGNLVKLRISQGAERSAPAWYVNRINVLTKPPTDNNIRIYNFPVFRWLDEHYRDRKTTIELELDTVPGYDTKEMQRIAKEEVRRSLKTKTGYLPRSSFDGAVKVTLYGTKPDSIFSAYLEALDNKLCPFEYGSEDLFEYFAASIGKLTAIEIEAEDNETNQTWFLESISVRVGEDPAIRYDIGHFLSVEEGGYRIRINVGQPYLKSSKVKSTEGVFASIQSLTPHITMYEDSGEGVLEQYEISIATAMCIGYIDGSIAASMEITGERGLSDNAILPLDLYQNLFAQSGYLLTGLTFTYTDCPVKGWIRIIRTRGNSTDDIGSAMRWTIENVQIKKLSSSVILKFFCNQTIHLNPEDDVAIGSLEPFDGLSLKSAW
ncbi:hypothetical protein ACOME3_001167 [Neoechinorhynchus agilis]